VGPQISVAPGGAVLGVNALQFPDVQNVHQFRGKDQQWSGISGHFTQISATNGPHYWGLNTEPSTNTDAGLPTSTSTRGRRLGFLGSAHPERIPLPTSLPPPRGCPCLLH
jgi:hypothetical protein